MTTQRTYLFHGDQVATASVTSGDTYDPVLINVQDRRLRKIARTASVPSTIVIEFDADTYIGGIAVLNTNANDTGSDFWRMYSDTPFGTQIAIGQFNVSRGPIQNGPSNLYGIVDDGNNIKCRAIVIELSVSPSSDLDIGRIFAGRVFWSENGGKYGSLGIGIIDPSVITRAIDSTPYVTQRQRYREGQLEFHALTEAELYLFDGTAGDGRQCLYDIEIANGSSSEVIVMPMYRGQTNDDGLIIDAQTIYGLAKWGRAEQYERCNGGFLYRKTIEITESV